MRRDIDNGDGTLDDSNKQDIYNLEKETKVLKAEGGSKDRCLEQCYAGTINREPDTCNDVDKVEQVGAEMKATKMTDDKVKEMIVRIQEASDVMTSNQLQTVIARCLEDGGDMKDKRYKDKGGERWGENEAEDVERCGADKGEGNSEGEGKRQQGVNDYPLGNPRLVEAHNFNFSIVVLRTGSARSPLRPLTVDNLPYSQHPRGDAHEGVGH